MPRDLFGSVTNPPAHIGTRSRLTLPLSLAAHAAALAVLVVAPLVATDVLPLPSDLVSVVLETPPLPVDPPRPIPRAPAPAAVVNPDAAPVEAPSSITSEAPARPPTDLGDVASGSTFTGAVFGAGGDDRVSGLTPPPAPAARAPVRPGGAITAPTKVHDVAPEYPPHARAARIQGIVIIQATIGVDGRVVNAEVLRAVPFLDQAALDAVRQWRFTPTRLNDEPVAVIMTVTVNFTLN